MYSCMPRLSWKWAPGSLALSSHSQPLSRSQVKYHSNFPVHVVMPVVPIPHSTTAFYFSKVQKPGHRGHTVVDLAMFCLFLVCCPVVEWHPLQRSKGKGFATFVSSFSCRVVSNRLVMILCNLIMILYSDVPVTSPNAGHQLGVEHQYRWSVSGKVIAWADCKLTGGVCLHYSVTCSSLVLISS